MNEATIVKEPQDRSSQLATPPNQTSKQNVQRLSPNMLPPEIRGAIQTDEEKQKALNAQLKYWSSDGTLQNLNELVTKYKYKIFDLPNLRIYAPDSMENLANELQKEFEEMVKVITPGKSAKNVLARIHITLVPGAEYCPRAAASLKDMRAIVDVHEPEAKFILRHEFTHAYMKLINTDPQTGNRGETFSIWAAEGAAVGFSHLRDPNDSRNNIKSLLGKGEFLSAATMNPRLGSHTQMLERVGYDLTQLSQQEKYEYSYIFGTLFFHFLINTYGQQKGVELFHIFYSKTCDTEQYDGTTREALVQKGVRLDWQPERKIAERGIKHLAYTLQKSGQNITSDQLLEQFTQFSKKYIRDNG